MIFSIIFPSVGVIITILTMYAAAYYPFLRDPQNMTPAAPGYSKRCRFCKTPAPREPNGACSNCGGPR